MATDPGPADPPDPGGVRPGVRPAVRLATVRPGVRPAVRLATVRPATPGDVEASMTWAAGAGAHKMALEVWPHNEAARALYRRCGFVEEGRRVRHYRRRNGELWDAVIMGRRLP